MYSAGAGSGPPKGSPPRRGEGRGARRALRAVRRALDQAQPAPHPEHPADAPGQPQPRRAADRPEATLAATSEPAVSLRKTRVRAGGRGRLHYVEEGEGPLVVLLHGFPEAWFGWERQIPMLAEAGFRVVAPDMRGYNLSGSRRGFQLQPRAAGGRRRGADPAPGGGEGARGRPRLGRRGRLVHGDRPPRGGRAAGRARRRRTRAATAALRHPRQLLKSWYVFFFQIPWLPEAAARARNWRLLRDPFEKDARAGAFGPGEIERYVESWSRPGAIGAQIDYYRSMGRTLARLRRRRTTRRSRPRR